MDTLIFMYEVAQWSLIALASGALGLLIIVDLITWSKGD